MHPEETYGRYLPETDKGCGKLNVQGSGQQHASNYTNEASVTTFDPSVYAALAANPAAQQAYIASINGAQPAAQPASQPLQGTPAAQATPAARGTLSQGFDQGAQSGSYGNSVKFPVVNYNFVGTVARDMLDTDVTQVTDFTTKQPKFLKSGSEQWQFRIALNVPVSQEFPEGKATVWTTKYRLHSALVHAMLSAGYTSGEGLREGDLLQITRVADVATQGQPGHDYQVSVTRAAGNSSAPATSAVPATQPAASSVTPVTPAASVPPTSSVPATPATTPGSASGAAAGADNLTPEQAALVAQYAAA